MLIYPLPLCTMAHDRYLEEEIVAEGKATFASNEKLNYNVLSVPRSNEKLNKAEPLCHIVCCVYYECLEDQEI